MRNRSVLAAVLLLAGGLGCTDSTPPEEHDLGPPAILASSIVLDSTARLGRFRFVASDPDGSVHIKCLGAFAGEADDSLTLVRPFAELRFEGEFLSTLCEATQGDSTTIGSAAVGQYAIDRLPSVMNPPSVPPLRVGEPSDWVLQVGDDWAVEEYWFASAPGNFPNCTTNWTEIGRWAGAGRAEIDTTVTTTFAAAGHYCMVIGVKDDLGRAFGYGFEVDVAP